MPSIVYAGSVRSHGYGHQIERVHNVPGVHADSHIYATICEIQEGGDVDDIRFIGQALMTVHSIAPIPAQPGEDLPSLEIRIHIAWEESLAFRLDVIVVNDDG